MLEFYEIAEIEKKWEEYDKNRKKASFFDTKLANLKFDKTIISLLAVIFVAIGAIFWILNDSDDEIVVSKINQDMIAKSNMPTISQVTGSNNSAQNDTQIAIKNDYNMTALQTNMQNSSERPTLNLNDIGVSSSVDNGGFTITNNYERNNAQNLNGNYAQNFPPQNRQNDFFNTNSIPKDEVIGFGSAPFPPKSQTKAQSPQKSSFGKIEIKTSKMNLNTKNLEEKFYSTNNIDYSLMLANRAYESKNYADAIKWALISNEIDKNSVDSWIIFAKASYKKGAKNDALKALETFNAKANNAEISNLILKIKSGKL